MIVRGSSCIFLQVLQNLKKANHRVLLAVRSPVSIPSNLANRNSVLELAKSVWGNQNFGGRNNYYPNIARSSAPSEHVIFTGVEEDRSNSDSIQEANGYFYVGTSKTQDLFEHLLGRSKKFLQATSQLRVNGFVELPIASFPHFTAHKLFDSICYDQKVKYFPSSYNRLLLIISFLSDALLACGQSKPPF